MTSAGVDERADVANFLSIPLVACECRPGVSKSHGLLRRIGRAAYRAATTS
jgi:hypothetical protein